MEQTLKDIIDFLSNPTIYFTLSCLGWYLMMRYYRRWTKPKYMIPVFVVSLVVLAWALTDPNFMHSSQQA